MFYFTIMTNLHFVCTSEPCNLKKNKPCAFYNASVSGQKFKMTYALYDYPRERKS